MTDPAMTSLLTDHFETATVNSEPSIDRIRARQRLRRRRRRTVGIVALGISVLAIGFLALGSSPLDTEDIVVTSDPDPDTTQVEVEEIIDWQALIGTRTRWSIISMSGFRDNRVRGDEYASFEVQHDQYVVIVGNDCRWRRNVAVLDDQGQLRLLRPEEGGDEGDVTTHGCYGDPNEALMGFGLPPHPSRTQDTLRLKLLSDEEIQLQRGDKTLIAKRNQLE